MGSVVKGIGSAVGSIGQFIPGSLSGSIHSAQKPQANPEEMVNPVDPRLKELRDKQFKQASDYRAGMQGEREKQYGLAQEASRRGLAQNLAQVNAMENKRGLLYGGHREMQEGKARAENAGLLNQQIKGINEQTEATANRLEAQAMGSGMGVNQLEQDRADRVYQMALQKQKDKAGAFGSLMGGAGGGMGLLAGK